MNKTTQKRQGKNFLTRLVPGALNLFIAALFCC